LLEESGDNKRKLPEIVGWNISNFEDIVITNPPFGTSKNEGIDVEFVIKAIELASIAVYSIHKTVTRDVQLIQPFFKEA